MSQNKAPAWVVPVMRFGYAARGVTYLILGVLMALAAWTGGQAEDTQSALASLRDQPFGLAALWVLAVGLFAYGVWRVIDAAMDLEDYGTGPKGFVARSGQTITGLIHFGLALTAARLAMGGSGGGGSEDGAETLYSWLLTQPYGRWIVAAVGIITICAGLYYGYKAWSEEYKEHLRLTRLTERLDPAVKAGLVAHGVVIAIIGMFLVYAGWTADADQAGGMGQAFQTVRSQPYGQFLLGALALGFMGFGIYCFIEAAYRIIPRVAGPDVATMASKAKRRAASQGRKAAARI